ncbi:hypothetical protein [Ralstonia sp. 24A2]|uniref:hypothetical protein n=1 Tax=Ralstonia sp. 24A2 TaxID=3447364 RepID=UPI003F69B8DD
MRIYRKSILALLCFFSAAAYAVDTVPSTMNPAPANSATKKGDFPCQPPSDAALRETLLAAGFVPDSPQGEEALRLSKKVFNDPTLRKRLCGSEKSELPLWSAKLSPTERLRSLQLMKTMVTATPRDCKVFLRAREGNVFQYLPLMSPVAMQSLLEASRIAALHKPSDDETGERSTIAEMLEADKLLSAAAKSSEVDSFDSPLELCEQIRLLVDQVVSAPEPLRSQASLALLRRTERQPSAVASVLSNPETYLNEAFDERQLPQFIRNSLPADGSRPLPFKRAVFDLEWTSKGARANPQRMITTFINRRNNGVIAEITRPADPSRDGTWTSFALLYGIATLRLHFVQPALRETQANLQDAAALIAANQSFKEGTTLRIPLPQPDYKGAKERICIVGRERPASTVFEKLTGSAIDLHCKQTSSKGVVTELHNVWLADYQTEMQLSEQNPYSQIELVIHGVTFE